MAAMSTTTFQNDKGTTLPIAYYPTGPASKVRLPKSHSKIASPNPLYAGVIADILDGN